MNKVFSKILFLIAILISHFSFSQNEMITDSNVVLKKGFYKTFQEFKTNSPSLFFDCKVSADYEMVSLFSEHKRYKLIFPDTTVLKSYLDIWGYCDGEKVYIKRDGDFKKRSKYDLMLNIGLYCYYKSTEVSGGGPMFVSSGAGGGMMMGGGGGGKSVVDILIDFNSGNVISGFSKNKVREIIQDDRILRNQFELSKGRYKNATKLKFIMMYSANNKDKIRRIILPKQ